MAVPESVIYAVRSFKNKIIDYNNKSDDLKRVRDKAIEAIQKYKEAKAEALQEDKRIKELSDWLNENDIKE